MKKILFFVLLLNTITVFAQTTTLKITTEDCRTSSDYDSDFIDTITMYKMPENKVAFVILRNYEDYKSPRVINNVPIGDYELYYKNDFKYPMIKKIRLVNDTLNSFTLCGDSLSAYPENTLAKLQNGDSLLVRYGTRGCYHHARLRLLLTKNQNQYTAQLYDAEQRIWSDNGEETRIEKDTLLRTIVLTDANIKSFIRFENELIALSGYDDDGCSSSDNYTITSKYLYLEKQDLTCHWSGFYQLRYELFGKAFWD